MFYTRRDFLKTTLGAATMLSLASPTPNLLLRAAGTDAARRNDRDTVLVVVQLSGGNDGLNTVVPYADDEYARNRPTLRLQPKDVHKINSYLEVRYSLADLADNAWCRDANAAVAAHLLATRRGNRALNH